MRSTPELEAAIRAAGLDRVLKVKHVAVEGVIAEFVVEGRPCPWKAPTVTKNGTFKDKTLVAWQKTVADHAALAMVGKYPYPGPVRLDLHFRLTRRPGSVPDLSNLTKALEDSLQGTVITNDRVVFQLHAERTMGDRDCVEIRVTSLESP